MTSDAEKFKSKRKALGLTQKDFADALGLGKNGDRTVRRWENGETSPSPIERKAILQFANEVPFPNVSETEAKFTFIDLFAGIGGIRIPFSENGGRCVFSSEWDKFAQKTYRINYGEEPHGDITKIDAAEIPDFDVLLGGFPCQPFSMAGRHLGFQDTRGTLFFEIERILRAKRPKAFLLENVKQLKRHDHGNTFKVIHDHLVQLDYEVHDQVLRAADFGVPQNRERIYIVGFDKHIFHGNSGFKFPDPPCTPTRVGDILESSPDEKYIISDRLWEGHQRRKTANKKAGKGFGYSLVDEESRYTQTMQARYYKDGSEILVDRGEGENPRKITPREAARLQGFPEKFIIPVSDTQAYKQFGNSVAVPVIRAVSKQMMQVILPASSDESQNVQIHK